MICIPVIDLINKQNEISLHFLIDGFRKIIDQPEELGFTRGLLSEEMLEFIEAI